MGILTAQRIESYYNTFKGIDMTFTKDMIQVTGLITEQVHLKCGSDFWPCVFFSTSFQGAKVVANIKSGLMNKLQKANNSVSLRFCFKSPEDGNPLTFFVAGRVIGVAPYKNSQDVSLLSVQFTQRPPDDLIEIIGRIFDANINSAKRKDDHIPITTESQRKIKLLSKETVVFIQGVPRRCILREVAFTNAKVIMLGVAKFLIDKEISVRFDFDDPRESFTIKGKVVDSEPVEGKQEMVALTLIYDEGNIPTGYKIRVNEYLNSTRLQSERDLFPVKQKNKLKEKSEKAEENAETEENAEADEITEADEIGEAEE
jgi:Tfp pilus assembly protein PilZ